LKKLLGQRPNNGLGRHVVYPSTTNLQCLDRGESNLSEISGFSRNRLLNLHQELGDGLVLRRATTADIEAAIDFTVRIHDCPGLGVTVRDLMCGDHPTTSANDFVLVADSNADNRIVAMAGLISQTWAYNGISFGVGNPEFIATDPAYRRRGLMRAVMDGLDYVSAARGHLIQAILGLRWFYRQFEYEYALNPGPRRQLHLSDIPPLPDGETEPYQIRRITEADIPLIMPLYQHQCAGKLVTNVLDEVIRRYNLSGYSLGSDMADWTFAVADSDDQFAGYYSTWGDPWGAFTIKELAVVENESLRQVLPSVLRFIQSQRITYAAEFGEKSPTRITFELGPDHPAYELLDTKLGPLQTRTDWYIRAPDIPQFLRHITPTLEKRLANSVMHDFTGELKVTFFQGGLRMILSGGKLSEIADWQATEDSETFHITGFPPLVFLKLLFGYRSLEELRYDFPDCWASEQNTLLLNALFPKQPSWLRQL
jgi:GNAT superfamily N-acetyltransferase